MLVVLELFLFQGEWPCNLFKLEDLGMVNNYDGGNQDCPRKTRTCGNPVLEATV